MVIIMKDNLKMVKQMVKENKLHQLVIFMKEIGLMINNVVKGMRTFQMVQTLKGSL